MRDVDIIVAFGQCGKPSDFSKKEYEAVMNFAQLLEKGKSLTGPQHQYLQAVYDKFIAKKYGLEPMGTDREFAARRAINKSRSQRGK